MKVGKYIVSYHYILIFYHLLSLIYKFNVFHAFFISFSSSQPYLTFSFISSSITLLKRRNWLKLEPNTRSMSEDKYNFFMRVGNIYVKIKHLKSVCNHQSFLILLPKTLLFRGLFVNYNLIWGLLGSIFINILEIKTLLILDMIFPLVYY